MSNFPQSSYVTIHFIDGTLMEVKFIAHNDSYLIGSDYTGNTVLVPYTHVKYIVSKIV